MKSISRGDLNHMPISTAVLANHFNSRGCHTYWRRYGVNFIILLCAFCLVCGMKYEAEVSCNPYYMRCAVLAISFAVLLSSQ
jgi:hypothetical protein